MVISPADIIFLRGIPKDNIYVGIKGWVHSLGLGTGNRNSGQEQDEGQVGGTCSIPRAGTGHHLGL